MSFTRNCIILRKANTIHHVYLGGARNSGTSRGTKGIAPITRRTKNSQALRTVGLGMGTSGFDEGRAGPFTPRPAAGAARAPRYGAVR